MRAGELSTVHLKFAACTYVYDLTSAKIKLKFNEFAVSMYMYVLYVHVHTYVCCFMCDCNIYTNTYMCFVVYHP